MMPWVLLKFIWTRKHFGDIWGGIEKVLKEVQFARAQINPPFITDYDEND